MVKVFLVLLSFPNLHALRVNKVNVYMLTTLTHKRGEKDCKEGYLLSSVVDLFFIFLYFVSFSPLSSIFNVEKLTKESLRWKQKEVNQHSMLHVH